MAVVANLAIAITARTRKFMKGMRKVQRRVETFARRTERYGRRLAMFGAAILAPIAGAVRMFTMYGDQIAKMAKRTGLAIRFLGALGYAAEITGASIEGLEKGIRRMAGAIIDAKDGMTEYLRAFQHLKVSPDELAQMAPADAFLKLADAIAKLQSPIMRAAMAKDVFGRAGTMLLPLFDQGAEGLKKLQNEYKALVGFTAESARAAEEWKDLMTRVKFAAIGLSTALAMGLGINVSDLSEKLVANVGRVRDWIGAHSEMLKSIAKVGAAILALGAAFLVMAGAAKVVAFALSPMGVWVVAITGVLTLLDALDVVNTGFADFLGNIRVGSHKISTWFQLAWLEIRQTWETLKGVLSTGWQGIGTLVGDVAGEIAKAWLKAFRAILDISEKVLGKRMPQAFKNAQFGITLLIEQITAEQEGAWARLWEENEDAAAKMVKATSAILQEQHDVLLRDLPKGAIDWAAKWRELMGGAAGDTQGAGIGGMRQLPGALRAGTAAEVTARSRMEYAMRGPQWQKDTAENTAETAANTEALAGQFANLKFLTMDVWKF